MKKFDVDKYLRKNPVEPLLPTDSCRCAVVIPAFDEVSAIPETLNSVLAAVSCSPVATAVIVVINYPPGADPEQSVKLLQDINSGIYPGVSAIYLPENSGGVGRARKIGMDSFIASVSPENMEKCAIFSLDADTTVEKDYICTVFPEVLNGGGVSIGFSHKKEKYPSFTVL